MRVLLFQKQFSFPNGGHMCTTACMQVAMAILCKQINVCSENALPSEHAALVHGLNGCMRVGSVVHGRVESILNARVPGGCFAQGGARDRMVSVNELLSILRIDLGTLGVCTEELLVCAQGRGTTLKLRVHSGSLDGSCHLLYEPTSCFICLDQLPGCMLVAPSACEGGGVCVALVTANGHTVCVACYGFGDRYAFCDPAPGEFCIGLSGTEMVEGLRHALRIPEEVVFSSNKRVGSNRRRGGGSSKNNIQNLLADEDCLIEFHCDVTLFYMRG
jgi:hypothetical protein